MIEAEIEKVRATVDWTVSSGDPMQGGNEDHYRGVGESALRVILASQAAASAVAPISILDFACATGRVTRWLRAAFPEAALSVADINPEWAAWSSQQFQAESWISSEDLRQIEAPRSYDLIWCGSLATHISSGETQTLMAKFYSWLNPGGIAVITTHGRQFLSNMVSGKLQYFASASSIPVLLNDLALNGYGYVPHLGMNHGISANTLEWAAQAIRNVGGKIVLISEAAWDGHQDAVAFQKVRV